MLLSGRPCHPSLSPKQVTSASLHIRPSRRSETGALSIRVPGVIDAIRLPTEPRAPRLYDDDEVRQVLGPHAVGIDPARFFWQPTKAEGCIFSL